MIRAQRQAYAAFYLRPRMIAHQLLKVRTLGAQDLLDGLRTLAAPLLDGLRARVAGRLGRAGAALRR